MKTLVLLDENQSGTGGQRQDGNKGTHQEPDGDIHHQEADQRTADGSSRPIDITALKTHDLQGPLQALEDRVFRKNLFFTAIHRNRDSCGDYSPL